MSRLRQNKDALATGSLQSALMEAIFCVSKRKYLQLQRSRRGRTGTWKTSASMSDSGRPGPDRDI